VQAKEVREQRNMILVGGYSPVDDKEDSRVTNAAKFALTSLFDGDDKTVEKYSFHSTLTSNNKKNQQNYDVEVVRGYDQVVAGMNYKLILRVVDNSQSASSCVGGLAVTVYDHFGDLSVTTYGKEFSCQELNALDQNESEFHQSYEQDFLSIGGNSGD